MHLSIEPLVYLLGLKALFSKTVFALADPEQWFRVIKPPKPFPELESSSLYTTH